MRSSTTSLVPVLPIPTPDARSDASSLSSFSAFTDSAVSSKRSRRMHQHHRHHTSEFAFSIDDDGRGAHNDDDAAILEYFSQRYNADRHQQPVLAARPRQPSAAAAAASAPYGFFYGASIDGRLRSDDAAAAEPTTSNPSLLTRRYAGYVLAALASGYVFAVVEFVLMRLDPRVLGLDSTHALRGLLDLQWAVVLLLGVLSDAFAPCGYRRNFYIVGGWLCTAILWLALAALFYCAVDVFGTAVPPASVATAGMAAAMLALIVATNALDVRVIELSQFEALHERGRVVATYQSLRIAAHALLHTLVLVMGRNDVGDSNNSNRTYLAVPVDVAAVLLHVGLVALLPIPFVLLCAHETRCKRVVDALTRKAPRAAAQLGETCRQFWQSAQQQVIWQLVAFNCILYFFTLLDYRDVTRAFAVWTGESPQLRRIRALVSDVAVGATLLLWRSYGVNACWIATIAVVIITWTLAYATANALVVWDVARVAWLPLLLGVLEAPLRVLLLLSAFVPTIEVAQVGSEGSIFGLLSSFQSIAKVLGAQLTSAIRTVGVTRGFAVDAADFATSSRAVQSRVFYAVLALVGAKLLALTAICFSPQQKLDAQQRRIYGGYSKRALLVFVSAYVVSFPIATYLQIRSVIE